MRPPALYRKAAMPRPLSFQGFGAADDVHEFLRNRCLAGLIVIESDLFNGCGALRVAPSMAAVRAPCFAAATICMALVIFWVFLKAAIFI
jgi:hypothetical protein